MSPIDDGRTGPTATVFGITGLFFTWSALPGLHWHDTAEFAAVARRLSISHAPGHPLHSMMCHAAEVLLPFGDVAFRANLSSGLAIALALALFYRLIRRLAPTLPMGIAVLVALMPAVVPSLWLQGIRAEVYGLQLLLSVAVALSAERLARGDGRGLVAMALTFGLAGANHSLMGVALIPLALVAMVLGLRHIRPFIASIFAGALGLSTYVYLVLRAPAGREVGWGIPDSADALWGVISARDWQRIPGGGQGFEWGENALRVTAYFIDQFGITVAGLLTVLWFAGFLVGGRPNAGRHAVVLVGLLGVVTTKLYYAFDPMNPDVGGYLAPAVLGLLVLAAMAVESLQQVTRFARLAIPVGLVLLIPGHDPEHRRDTRGAEMFGRSMLDEVPPDGAMIYSDYSSTFQGWYLRAAEGVRPDVALIFRGQVGTDWQQRRLARQGGIWADMIGSFPQGFGDSAVHFEPGVMSERLGALQDQLQPVGTTLSIDTVDQTTVIARWKLVDSHPYDDFDTQRAIAFAHAEHAVFLIKARRQRSLAVWHLEQAEARAGRDPMLISLTEQLNGHAP